ncbi:zinc finger protein 91 isoform X1 [Drosophila nasuta]|uniref:zinc finger protein 91 isoform X1 n=2 Tax=Drosophila nasuta TaxID=42062 RepID=UPI00295E7AEE|nr:zinc finger protein 91 isoform X1 [Drosophila nasuta]
MLPTDICRTCALHNVKLLALSTRNAKYANKSWCDILYELTQNDPLMEQLDDNLPQYLCDDCLRKLEDAYAFVLQARQVHEQLLHKLHKNLQCLDEAPIDIATNEIKSETDLALEQIDNAAAALDVAGGEAIAATLKIQPESDSDSNVGKTESVEARGNVLDLKPTQLRRSNRKPKLATDSENEETSNLKAMPLKRRRGRPARVSKNEVINKDGRHACDVCGKTFSWHRDMQRHARVHYEQAAYECDTCGKRFLRKDKYTFHLRSHEKRQAKHAQTTLPQGDEWRFAERLYSSARLKRIECKLCDLKCQRIQELREHLTNHHVNIESLCNLSNNSDVIREHFDSQASNLEQIKQQVCSEIATGSDQLDKYCVIINAHGYELSLNDSDEELADTTPAYQCLSCNISFKRKHHLIRHTLEEHTQTPLHRCNTCQIGFVCEILLEQHQRTQCQNQLKRHSCPNCPGKFIWLQNLKQHGCSKKTDQERQFQCCLCDEQLHSMSALRSHLLQHGDGGSGIDANQTAAYFRYHYPNGVTCSQEELSTRISNDFKVQDYGQYFNACSGSGRELDFFASDTELSDVEQLTTSTSALHSCTLCGVATARLAQLLRHQEDRHSDVTNYLPHVCNKCGLGFVAESLLQQHLRRICDKRHASFHCEPCNLHFIWQTNYERHMAIKHEVDTEEDQEQTHNTRLRSKRQQAAKLQCNQCEKVFIWPKDLTRHKRIHQPQASAQFECSFCERKFHRKDGLKSHLRVHGEQQLEVPLTPVEQMDASVLQRMPAVLTQLCRPNGCKQIQCMICLSQHTKISDLRAHLMKHQISVEFVGERAKPESISSISRGLYPELSTPLDKQQLIERIQRDLGKGIELERFVSITNEAAIELSLDSSETETDSDSTESQQTDTGRQYNCDLCQVQLTRKHQLYAHQLQQHTWQEATLVCSHCQAKFVNEQLLEHHYRTLCRNAQKRFLCRKCPLRFRWRDNLKLHIDVAHQEAAGSQSSIQGIQLNTTSLLPIVSYDCQECNRSFKMQKDLTRHTLMHAQDSSIYRCRWCARRFYRETNLLQHIERHGINAAQLPYAEAILNASRHPHGQKCIQCKVCDMRFPTIALLRTHLMSTPNGSHHDVGSMLNYSITNQLGYELHLDDSETDEEGKPPGVPTHYTCGMCQLRCVRKYELYQHQQAMHRLERIAEGCDKCIYKSVSSDLIAYHRRVLCDNTEKQFKCVKCGYKFMWETNLLQHIQLQHPSNDNQQVEEIPQSLELSAAEGQIFQCGQCPRKYNRKDRLTAHVKKCHAPGAVSPTIANAPKAAKAAATVAKQHKSFLCAFCGKAVSSSSNLIIHIRRHTGEKPFKCDFCDMAFPRSSDLQCHRRTHTGERPHVCTVCQKGFARSYKLQQHMRIHNGERPYKCTYCDKSFTQSNDLTLHIRRHTGERPYQCETCGERFIQGTALKNHRLQNGHFETSDSLAKNN